ncbi:hypothetical protein [Maridesulfovibrio zosterae]|uniref:hypothetical protein n=1 Tax=Maridesulfovibrio zosterae TaxID=82171 RepID=UPI0003FEBFAC|nr:hypothetical protein [Maridesulfovibrio zosterae]
MGTMRILLFIIIATLSFTSSTEAREIIYAAGLKGTKTGYDKLVKEKGGDPFAIKDYTSHIASRPVTSLLIIQQALKMGGMDAEIRFASYPNIARSLAEVKKGKVSILATDMWEMDFDDSVYKTDPFIRKGDFEKGIYTYKDSPLLKSKPDLKQLLQYCPLTESSWTIDIDLLKMMGFKRIQTAPKYDLLFKMLNKRRADFLLLELSRSPDFIYKKNDAPVKVIKGVKIIFPYSRHFMVSKRHPDGKKIFTALQCGLKKLREDGTLERALYQSGIKDKRIKDWKVIYQ